MGTAIVAIPREDDYVWNLSSEKIPHMTLLFLDDLANNPKLDEVVSFIEHVVNTSLTRFGLSVSRRGELGVDQADVLFFEKYGLKKIEEFRSYLLKNEVIYSAFHSVEQFDGWTPHLTLGYPATPAKKDTRDYPGTSWVSFDKIAIWTGDFEGPEFLIPNDENLEVSMSDVESKKLDDVLAHFGVKGMKWGQRKARRSSGPVSSDAARAQAAQDIIKKHGTKALDNKELQHLVTRMNLESQYAGLVDRKHGTIKRGQNKVKDLLSIAKTAQDAYSLATGPMAKGIAKAIETERKKKAA